MQYISPGMQVLRHISHHILYVLSSICAWERVQRVVFLGRVLQLPYLQPCIKKRMEMVGHRLCHTITILYLERLPKAQIWYLNENHYKNHRAPASLQYAHQAGWTGCLVHNFDAIIVSTQAVCRCIHANLSGLEFTAFRETTQELGPVSTATVTTTMKRPTPTYPNYKQHHPGGSDGSSQGATTFASGSGSSTHQTHRCDWSVEDPKTENHRKPSWQDPRKWGSEALIRHILLKQITFVKHDFWEWHRKAISNDAGLDVKPLKFGCRLPGGEGARDFRDIPYFQGTIWKDPFPQNLEKVST